METIHTDSAYKALSRKSFSKAEIKTPFDKTVNGDERRTLADSDGQDQLSDLKKEVDFSISFLCQCINFYFFTSLIMGRNECRRINRVLSDTCGKLLMTRSKKLKMLIPLCSMAC